MQLEVNVDLANLLEHLSIAPQQEYSSSAASVILSCGFHDVIRFDLFGQFTTHQVRLHGNL